MKKFKENFRIIMIFFVISFVALGALIVYFLSNPKQIVPTFEIHPQIIEAGIYESLEPFIIIITTESDDELIYSETGNLMDYDTPGEYEVTIRLEDESGNYSEESVTITVEDTTGPSFTVTDQEIEIGQSDIDWSTYITDTFDNSDGVLVKSEVLDNVDYNSLGIYSVTVNLTDESLNETSKTFNVEVVDPVEDPEDPIEDPEDPIDEPMFNPFANPDYVVSTLSEGWDFIDINPLDLMNFETYDYDTYRTSTTILDNSNNTFVSDEYRYIPSLHGMYLVKNMDTNSNLYGMADPNFEIIVDIMYDAVQPFVNGYTNISLNGLNATIDLEGNIIHDWQPNLIFPSIEKDIWLIVEDFENNPVLNELISYFIDIDGNKISEDFTLHFVNSSISADNIYVMGYSYHQFERSFTLNSITVEVDGFYGVYDFSGQKIIDTNNWNIVYHEDEDIYYRRYYETPGEVSTNKMEFVDSEGAFLFDYSGFTYYDPRSEFYEGLLSIPLNNINSLLIDTSGEIIYESPDITTLYNDVYIAFDISYDMALKNIDGEMISIEYYDDITWYYDSPFIVTHFDGTKQFMDYTGQLLYDAYSTLLPYDGDYAVYSIDGFYYAMNQAGVTTHVIGTTPPDDILDDVSLTRRNVLNNAGEALYDMVTDSYSDRDSYVLLFGDIFVYLRSSYLPGN